jgi:hypothetical protein
MRGTHRGRGTRPRRVSFVSSIWVSPMSQPCAQ